MKQYLRSSLQIAMIFIGIGLISLDSLLLDVVGGLLVIFGLDWRYVRR